MSKCNMPSLIFKMILDCTLRDGGYYVNWDFEDKLIQKYISSLIKANVDIIELGLDFCQITNFMVLLLILQMNI